LLVEAYVEAALSKTMCCDKFRRFKVVILMWKPQNMLEDQNASCILVEDAEMKALFDEDPCHMQEELAE